MIVQFDNSKKSYRLNEAVNCAFSWSHLCDNFSSTSIDPLDFQLSNSRNRVWVSLCFQLFCQLLSSWRLDNPKFVVSIVWKTFPVGHVTVILNIRCESSCFLLVTAEAAFFLSCSESHLQIVLEFGDFLHPCPKNTLCSETWIEPPNLSQPIVFGIFGSFSNSTIQYRFRCQVTVVPKLSRLISTTGNHVRKLGHFWEFVKLDERISMDVF